jgi:hypothetical protein
MITGRTYFVDGRQISIGERFSDIAKEVCVKAEGDVDSKAKALGDADKLLVILFG